MLHYRIFRKLISPGEIVRWYIEMALSNSVYSYLREASYFRVKF